MTSTNRAGVLVSQPVHQHAYETVLAAQEADLLEHFVTGLYLTGRGLTSPDACRRLVATAIGQQVERQLRRRWHPKLDSDRVVSISRYHLPAMMFSKTIGRLPPLRHVDADVWAHLKFDSVVARRLQRSRNIGLVHAFEGSAAATLRAAKELGITTVLDVPSAHERFLQVEAEEGGRPHRHRAVEITAERGLADVLFAPSDHVIACLTEAGVDAARIVKIPYGADPSTFRPNPGTGYRDAFRALFVGQIGLRKGVRYLLEAWRRLNLRGAELVLVGQPDRWGQSILRQYAGHYRWAGNIPKHEVHRWYQRSSVFVFPSLAEGSASVTYEAMASGLPLITTPNSGSVMRDGIDGFMVPVRDIDSICDRLRILHDDPDMRLHMGAMGRAHIEGEYTWPHYRRRVVTAYRSILDGQPLPLLNEHR
jgi:starch synthase